MRSPRRFSCSYCLVVLCVSIAGGCGEPVREDRTITWSLGGEATGFQHGQEGVFVAGKAGGEPTKVFEPGPEVIATSTPLWSPVGRRMIFTTARNAAGGEAPPRIVPWEQDPAGNVHMHGPSLYTCWLHEEAADGAAAPPVALFEAACGHVGYVAANLAVRWNPQGDRVLYVHHDEHGHGIFEFDLAAKDSRRVFPHSADAVIFDWTPDGSNLVCVLGSTGNRPSDGIWIGQPGGDDWWHVPESSGLAEGELPSVLERLRATRPAWTADGGRFAFASTAAARPHAARQFYLRVGNRVTRTVDSWLDGPETFSDLHWAPDEALGFVRAGKDPSLHAIRPGRDPAVAVNEKPVRRFAGWNAKGDRLAYVAPAEIPFADGDIWAFLLLPDALARDAVYVADGAANDPGEAVFDGMRVTFPHWSPREDKLSLWVTFTPCYQSWLSRLFGLGLRPGDPAAVLDAETGKIGWMAVNAFEKAQVGHYYLRRRDYEEALRWYDEAASEQPPAGPPTTQQFLAQLASPRGFTFFHYYCLKKLGRDEDAQAKLVQFEQQFQPKSPDPAVREAGAAGEADRILRELLDPRGLAVALLRDLYIAEVFLSVDAAEDAETFFRAAIANQDDTKRLSATIVLGQILLIERKPEQYAEMATDVLVPCLLKLSRHRTAEELLGEADLQQTVMMVAGGLSLLPLYAPEFLAALPNEQLTKLADSWVRFEPAEGDAVARLAIDLFLEPAYATLGRQDERQAAAERIAANPARSKILADGDEAGGIDDLLKVSVPRGRYSGHRLEGAHGPRSLRGVLAGRKDAGFGRP